VNVGEPSDSEAAARGEALVTAVLVDLIATARMPLCKPYTGRCAVCAETPGPRREIEGIRRRSDCDVTSTHERRSGLSPLVVWAEDCRSRSIMRPERSIRNDRRPV
jgi:hypothetical protein